VQEDTNMKKRNRQILIFVAIAIALYYLYNYFKNSNKEISVQANEMSQGAGVMTKPTTAQNVVVGTDNLGDPVSYMASSSVSGRPVTFVR
jgi:ABC-type dipeptide/oligopeptide/nickel transport system permease subunit